MMAILRAPELSATSKIDRVWIMAVLRRLHFGRLPDDALQSPALAPAHRPRLDDGDGVAGFRLVLLVVDHERRRAALGLAVEPVAHLPLHRHDDALLHLVADDDPDLLRLVSHMNPVVVSCQLSVWPLATGYYAFASSPS